MWRASAEAPLPTTSDNAPLRPHTGARTPTPRPQLGHRPRPNHLRQAANFASVAPAVSTSRRIRTALRTGGRFCFQGGRSLELCRPLAGERGADAWDQAKLLNHRQLIVARPAFDRAVTVAEPRDVEADEVHGWIREGVQPARLLGSRGVLVGVGGCSGVRSGFAATPGGDRPVLVLTRDPVADRIGSVVVAALTRTRRGLVSELRQRAHPAALDLPASGDAAVCTADDARRSDAPRRARLLIGEPPSEKISQVWLRYRRKGGHCATWCLRRRHKQSAADDRLGTSGGGLLCGVSDFGGGSYHVPVQPSHAEPAAECV
jgi:mRNA-degrading endonuclease toxin of MazEF toxin-antitoxin module